MPEPLEEKACSRPCLSWFEFGPDLVNISLRIQTLCPLGATYKVWPREVDHLSKIVDPVWQVATATIACRLSPGEAVVHSEHGGNLLTTRRSLLGTSFFAKRKFADGPDYQDPKNGPQGFCRRFGAVLNHQVEVRRLRPSREYGSYADWPTAYGHLRGQRHLEEVVKEGCPCKPYLDLERDGGLAEGETLETVIAAFQEATIRIFREDYNFELREEAFNWIPCDYGPW